MCHLTFSYWITFGEHMGVFRSIWGHGRTVVALSSFWKSCWVAHWAHDRQPTARTKFKFMWFNGCKIPHYRAYSMNLGNQCWIISPSVYMVMVPLCIPGYHQLCLCHSSPRWETLTSIFFFKCLAVDQTFALDPGYRPVDRVFECDQGRKQRLRLSRYMSSRQRNHSRCMSNEGDPIR